VLPFRCLAPGGTNSSSSSGPKYVPSMKQARQAKLHFQLGLTSLHERPAWLDKPSKQFKPACLGLLAGHHGWGSPRLCKMGAPEGGRTNARRHTLEHLSVDSFAQAIIRPRTYRGSKHSSGEKSRASPLTDCDVFSNLSDVRSMLAPDISAAIDPFLRINRVEAFPSSVSSLGSSKK
jgi:hypothetical protein